MTRFVKRSIFQIVSITGVLVMLYCFARMIPYGITGQISKVKGYFVIAMITLVISLPCSIAYYFYRENAEDKELARLRIETDTLAQLGQQNNQQGKQVSSPPSVAPDISQPKDTRHDHTV